MNLSVNIELETKEVKVGEVLRGRVLVSCPDKIACRGIRLEVGYRVHGKGNPYREMIYNDFLHRGELPAGSHLVLPFAVSIPADGPITYYVNGSYINVTWFAQARIDIPLLADQRFSEEFIVEPLEE